MIFDKKQQDFLPKDFFNLNVLHCTESLKLKTDFKFMHSFAQITNFWNFQKVCLRLQIQHFDDENISAVRCTSEWGQMTKLDKAATSHKMKILGGGEGGVLVPM